MTCPSCRSQSLRRRKRVGLRMHLLSILGRWPYRCESCGMEFLLKKRYAREPHVHAKAPDQQHG